MRFGRHVVTNVEQEIELNEAEQKELKNDGPKHWFSVKTEGEKYAENAKGKPSATPEAIEAMEKKYSKKIKKKASKKVSKKAE